MQQSSMSVSSCFHFLDRSKVNAQADHSIDHVVDLFNFFLATSVVQFAER